MGIVIGFGNNIVIYNNNFINNQWQAPSISASTEIYFNLEEPVGGNYWSNHTSPDINEDGFVDTPYSFDNMPWTVQDGWLTPPLSIDGLIENVLNSSLKKGEKNALLKKLENADKSDR